MESNVNLFPVSLITGEIGFPVGVPLPVVKIIIWAPPATIPVIDSISWPGVSIIYNPFVWGISAYSKTPWNSLVPDLWMHPNDFSSIVVIPPTIFPGVGCPPRISTPNNIAFSSQFLTNSIISFETFSFFPLFATTCSAPINSVVSDKILVPPKSIIISEQTPHVGLEAKPDVVSDPPHSIPKIISEMSHSTLSSKDNSWTNFLAIATPFA